MRILLTALILLSLVGCATTRLGEHDNSWYIVGVNDTIEVQANQVYGEFDTWYVRIINTGEVDYEVKVDWRTVDYTNYVFQGWVELPAGKSRSMGYFIQEEWELNGKKLNLEDGMIKMYSIEIEEVKE